VKALEQRPTVLIGANGQLGSDLARGAGSKRRLVALCRADLELRDHDQVARTLEAIRPAVIVNTAAFHKVEACETDVEQAFNVNCVAVRNLAQVANSLEARLVHMSTDYVFDGESDVPYAEGAAPNPINAYGNSKVAGEFFVRNICRHHLIIRTSGLYGVAGSSGKGGNFVQTMLKLGRERGRVSVVRDQVLSPTYTYDLANMIWALVDAQAEGLFHVTNRGSCSWFEFARAIFELSGMSVDIQPVTTDEMGGTVRRPRSSVLANARLESSGFELLRPWHEALANYLEAAREPSPISLGTRQGQG
jgi:dTDP-4-dehydrorhamnose reductase